MSPSNERSAEWLRGAKWAFLECGEPLAASKMSTLLAAAEAREAGKRGGVGSAENSSQVIENAITLGGVEASQPTAAEVIEACRVALERLLPWALQAGANAEDALALCARWKEANGG